MNSCAIQLRSAQKRGQLSRENAARRPPRKRCHLRKDATDYSSPHCALDIRGSCLRKADPSAYAVQVQGDVKDASPGCLAQCCAHLGVGCKRIEGG